MRCSTRCPRGRSARRRRLSFPSGAREPATGSSPRPASLVSRPCTPPSSPAATAWRGRRPEESHFLLVLTGTFTLQLNGTAVQLSAGQSIAFRGTDSYSWANLSADTPCEVVWVLSPPAI